MSDYSPEDLGLVAKHLNEYHSALVDVLKRLEMGPTKVRNSLSFEGHEAVSHMGYSPINLGDNTSVVPICSLQIKGSNNAQMSGIFCPKSITGNVVATAVIPSAAGMNPLLALSCSNGSIVLYDAATLAFVETVFTPRACEVIKFMCVVDSTTLLAGGSKGLYMATKTLPSDTWVKCEVSTEPIAAMDHLRAYLVTVDNDGGLRVYRLGSGIPQKIVSKKLSWVPRVVKVVYIDDEPYVLALRSHTPQLNFYSVKWLANGNFPANRKVIELIEHSTDSFALDVALDNTGTRYAAIIVEGPLVKVTIGDIKDTSVSSTIVVPSKEWESSKVNFSRVHLAWSRSGTVIWITGATGNVSGVHASDGHILKNLRHDRVKHCVLVNSVGIDEFVITIGFDRSAKWWRR